MYNNTNEYIEKKKSNSNERNGNTVISTSDIGKQNRSSDNTDRDNKRFMKCGLHL